MIRYTMAMIAGIALTAPALAQDANHIRIDGQIYDLRTLGAPPMPAKPAQPDMPASSTKIRTPAS
jgi:hypothetical protein